MQQLVLGQIGFLKLVPFVTSTDVRRPADSGSAILYVSAGLSSNVSLTVKPGVILMPTRSAPRPPQTASIPSQVKRVRFSSGPPQRQYGDSISSP